MRRLLSTIEVILILAAIGFAVAWALSPEKQYEPYIVLITIVGAGITEFGRRRRKANIVNELPVTAEPTQAGAGEELTLSNQAEAQTLHPSESASFFAQRFAQAFPGVRTIQWYKDREAIKRLKVLLKDPLIFKHKDGQTIPIWWWRGGNLPIPFFKTLSKGVVLLDTKELKIKRIAAVPSSSYYRSIVYLESEPMKPCGAYKWNEKKIEQWVHDHGYAWEEYGLYKGKHVVSRAEYDDNAATIKGKIVTLGSDVELRERYITPYNLIIAPHLSPINNSEFDATLRSFMDRMLQGKADIEELADQVKHLPKHRAWGQYE